MHQDARITWMIPSSDQKRVGRKGHFIRSFIYLHVTYPISASGYRDKGVPVLYQSRRHPWNGVSSISSFSIPANTGVEYIFTPRAPLSASLPLFPARQNQPELHSDHTSHVSVKAMAPTPRIRTVEGSCWGCKERRVICDLTVPTCDKCAKIGRRCDYGKVRLRWTDCVASRGRLAGKKIPLYQAPVLQRNLDTHMLYFENELLPRFNISNTVPTIDLTFLSRDPILTQSIVAVANAHQTYASGSTDENLSVARIQDRNNALRMFRKHLMAAHDEDTNNSLFIANVLLCILDGIIEPISENSAATHHHLVGGKAILKHWGGVRDIFGQKEELPILMLSIFTTMDLTHALLIGDEPYLEPSSWVRYGNAEAWWGMVGPDDDFLQTMATFSTLATLGHGVRHRNNTVPIDTLLSIQMSLERQASASPQADDGTPMAAERLAWAAFCAVYRFTASVYLYRALSGLYIDHPLVQKAVADCMDVIAGADLTSKLHHCILFPLLVVGTLCMEEEQRVVIRRSIEQTSVYLSFESLRSFKVFLETRWGKLDAKSEDYMRSNWWWYFEEIAPSTCLF